MNIERECCGTFKGAPHRKTCAKFKGYTQADIEAAVLAEREACAKVCEEQSPLDAMVDEEFGSAAMVRVADAMAKLNATAIRARGEK